MELHPGKTFGGPTLGPKVAEMGERLDSKDISSVKSIGLRDRFEKGESGNGGVVYQDENKEVA